CFTTENEKIIWPKCHIVISALAFRRQKKITCIRRLRTLQVIERIPESLVHFVPIVKTGAFEVPIVKGKPEGLYQVQRRVGRHTKPSNVAGVRRNFWLNQNDVEHEISQEPRKARKNITSEFSCVLAFLRDYNFEATNFSSFTTSAANLRIPSPVFSYAIALSFSNQRNFFSSNSSLSIFACFAFSGSSLRSSGSVDSESSFISSGLRVGQSQPASSQICPTLRKLAPITSVGIPNFL